MYKNVKNNQEENVNNDERDQLEISSPKGSRKTPVHHSRSRSLNLCV